MFFSTTRGIHTTPGPGHYKTPSSFDKIAKKASDAEVRLRRGPDRGLRGVFPRDKRYPPVVDPHPGPGHYLSKDDPSLAKKDPKVLLKQVAEQAAKLAAKRSLTKAVVETVEAKLALEEKQIRLLNRRTLERKKEEKLQRKRFEAEFDPAHPWVHEGRGHPIPFNTTEQRFSTPETFKPGPGYYLNQEMPTVHPFVKTIGKYLVGHDLPRPKSQLDGANHNMPAEPPPFRRTVPARRGAKKKSDDQPGEWPPGGGYMDMPQSFGSSRASSFMASFASHGRKSFSGPAYGYYGNSSRFRSSHSSHGSPLYV